MAGNDLVIFHNPFCLSFFRSVHNSLSDIAYCLLSNVVLMFVSAFWRLETDRPTAVFRTIDPFTPVSPACSEPMAMMR
jgi:hypothetical protein